MLKWQHIEYLFGLGALPLLGLLLYTLLRWKKKTKARIGDPALVGQLVKNFSPLRFGIKVGLVLLALIGVILGAANFQRPGAMQNVNRRGVDVMLVLDVSKSMLARDIKPSRLEKAKQLLIRLTDRLENDRIGLVLFAGRAYLQMPLTTDHGAAHIYIQDASPDIVPTQGTVIGEALRMANTAFNSKERKYKAIILLSDGEDHDPEALKVAKELASNGVMINTVGIGSAEGSPIVDPVTNELKKDEQGNTVISKLNEAELQQLADATNGRYIRLDNLDDVLITMNQQLDGVEKKSLNDTAFIDYISYFQWFLGIALVLLLAEYFLPERRRRNLRLTMGMGLLFLCCSLTSSAQKENALIRSGNRYYKQKQVDQSLKQYEDAVKKAPGNPTANYNLGNAFFRKNNYNDAANSYNASVEHTTDKAMQEKGLYNKGVALVKQQKLQESIDAWKNALKLDAGDEDARENLQKALQQMKQQQQSQQEKEKKDQKEKKEQKDKKEENKEQEQPQQPKPQPSRLTKQQVEQYLKTLEQKEKDIQDKMNQNKAKAPNQPEKDW
ncbi:MAG: VWA domain-containing protein [Chitinophagaceae bacterium]|nr:VWA domain-containing protein [Chitinophagaceae bacterium]